MRIIRHVDDEFEGFMSEMRWQAYNGDRKPWAVARDINFSASTNPDDAMRRLRGIESSFHAVGGSAAENGLRKGRRPLPRSPTPDVRK